jgi:hypothetical protein
MSEDNHKDIEDSDKSKDTKHSNSSALYQKSQTGVDVGVETTSTQTTDPSIPRSAKTTQSSEESSEVVDEEVVESKDKCFICRQKITNRAKTDSSCGHDFCLKCLQDSTRERRECPQCRQPITEIRHNIVTVEESDIVDVRRPTPQPVGALFVAGVPHFDPYRARVRENWRRRSREYRRRQRIRRLRQQRRRERLRQRARDRYARDRARQRVGRGGGSRRRSRSRSTRSGRRRR